MEINFFDHKIKTNQTQYKSNRETAKTSSFKELDNCEYFTGENVGYKSGVVEQAKFHYSTLGKVSNKGLNEKDKKVGPPKRLTNMDNKNKKVVKID